MLQPKSATESGLNKGVLKNVIKTYEYIDFFFFKLGLIFLVT